MISRDPMQATEQLNATGVSNAADIRQLPVTLLSGFLGSGKTTLLEHILKSADHGLRIAVIVNDMSTLNIDASLIQHHTVSRSKEKLIQLQNGCICCTLRGDLLEELVRLARADQVEYVVIESTGISEPMQVAETFTSEFTQAMIEQGDFDDGEADNAIMKEIASIGGLHKLARLDTTVTVIDAFNLFSNFSTSEFLSDRWGSENITPEDERTISDLLVDQIEFADVIIVNKIETIDADTKQRVLRVCKQLNPTAKVLETSYSKVDVREIVNTNMFDFEKAATGSGWLKSLHELTKRDVGGNIKLAPKPETEEYGISSFVYSARRPFHPKRLYNLIHDKFIVLQNVEQEEDENGENSSNTSEDSDFEMIDADGNESVSSADDELKGKDFSTEIPTEKILQNKRNHPTFSSLLRSKGFFWLATRPRQHGEWSQAGSILTLQGGGPWFSTLDRSFWPKDPTICAAIEADFEGPWGDRRQELVFIGENINQTILTKLLDECLLKTPEMRRWERVMKYNDISDEEREDKLARIFDDGFEDWATTPLMIDEEEGHEGHHHH